MPRPSSTTARLESARANRLRVIDEKLQLVSLLSRVWPSHLSPTTRGGAWSHVVCIHSPAGQLAWRLTDDEMPLFAHLTETATDWDKHSAEDKAARIEQLITLGW